MSARKKNFLQEISVTWCVAGCHIVQLEKNDTFLASVMYSHNSHMPAFTERSKKTKMFKGNSVDLGLAASKNLIIIPKYFFSDQRVELAEK